MLKTLVWLTSFYQFTLTEPIDYPAQLFPHSFKLPGIYEFFLENSRWKFSGECIAMMEENCHFNISLIS